MFNMVRGGNFFINCILKGKKIKIKVKEFNGVDLD